MIDLIVIGVIGLYSVVQFGLWLQTPKVTTELWLLIIAIIIGVIGYFVLGQPVFLW